MPRKKNEISKAEKTELSARKMQHKLNSIRTDFEAGKIASFEQIFAIMAESRLAQELHMGFDTFRNKVRSPGDFTVNELLRFSDLLNVNSELVFDFIFKLLRRKKNA